MKINDFDYERFYLNLYNVYCFHSTVPLDPSSEKGSIVSIQPYLLYCFNLTVGFRQRPKMSTGFVDSLIEHVIAENDMSALLRMVPRIGIDVCTLQSLMTNFIGTLNENAARKALLNVQPIDTLLPMDVIQHISKFNHRESLQKINKAFKKCYDNNQEMLKRIREDLIEEYENEFNPEVDYNETTNQIFILYPMGKISAEFEKRKAHGQRVSKCHDFAQCVNTAQWGDKILIEDGVYTIPHVNGLHIHTKHLQIIGIGSNVKLNFGHNYRLEQGQGLLYITEGSQILFKNLEINFQCDEQEFVPPIVMRYSSSIWMENCKLSAPSQLLESSNSSIYMKSCSISFGGSITLAKCQSHVTHNANSNFTAIACTFDMNMGRRTVFEIQAKVNLKFVGNIFKRASVGFFIFRECSALFNGNVFEDCHVIEWIRNSNRVLG